MEWEARREIFFEKKNEKKHKKKQSLVKNMKSIIRTLILGSSFRRYGLS